MLVLDVIGYTLRLHNRQILSVFLRICSGFDHFSSQLFHARLNSLGINVNKNPTDVTVCRYLFNAKLLYIFQVSQHPSSGVLKTVTAASGTGHTTCTAPPHQRGLIWTGLCESRATRTNTIYRSDRDAVPIRPRWWGGAVQVVCPVREAAVTVLSTPDDGCCDT